MSRASRSSVNWTLGAGCAPTVLARHGHRPFPPDGEALAEIRSALASNLFVGAGHRRVWASLWQEHGVLGLGHSTRLRWTTTHDLTITSDALGELQKIDSSGCLTAEGNAAGCAAFDHYAVESLFVVAGWMATRSAQRTGRSAVGRAGNGQRQLVS